MAQDHSADLMQALMAKLYATITGNDNSIKMPRNKFVSWMLPGIPFQPKDFLFCAKGLVGDSAEDTRARQHEAWALARLLDFVPDVNNQFVDTTMQQTLFTSTQDTISSVYNDVLRYSKVVHHELSQKEQDKLKKFRDLLSVTKVEEDLFTEEKREVTVPGPLTLAYTAKLNDYIDAADEYMNLLIDAQSAKGKDAESIRRVAAWANKSKFMRKKVEAAEMAWVSQGYKNEYETINAYINQVTQKSMVLYKEDLLRKFNNGLLTSTQEGTAGDFHYTTLVPGNFATSPGWTRFSFAENDFATHSKQKTSAWGASSGVNLGFVSFGAKASRSKATSASDQKASNFHAELQFTQVPIVRPWFDPGFFSMRGWTLDKLWNLNFDKTVSDGADKPSGRLVAYPITALFVKDVKFFFSEVESHSRYANTQVKAGGSVGWGPFSLGGSYSHGSVESSAGYHGESGKVEIKGLQLIGFINNLIPKSPNPNPEIKPEQFVGGS